ncbi:hypothetical protein ACFV0O_04615 [Kitasatospora sp. NPDC059577]|uniref:hypothetical protein n=1 Tax=Kitasatospora sp. NPDC059577 TaxID=3346873 RepID=UPI0036BFA050
MHAIRFHLRAPDGPRSTDQPTPESVRDGLERGLRGPVRVGHARIVAGPGTVDAVVFTLADDLITAEAALTAACAELVGTDGPLPGWRVAHCGLDTWLTLGPYEPSHR